LTSTIDYADFRQVIQEQSWHISSRAACPEILLMILVNHVNRMSQLPVMFMCIWPVSVRGQAGGIRWQ